MALSFVAASSSVSSTNSSSQALAAWPTGVADGDLLILVVSARQGSSPPTFTTTANEGNTAGTMTAWSRIGSIASGSGGVDVTAVAWWARYRTGLTLPTVTASTAVTISLGCLAFRGADASSPVASWTTGLVGATTTVTIPAATGTRGNTVLGFAFGRSATVAGVNVTAAPATYTSELIDVAAGAGLTQSLCLWGGMGTVPRSGSVASSTVTFSSSLSVCASAVLELRPANLLTGVADSAVTGLTWHVEFKPTVTALSASTLLQLASADPGSVWYQAPQSVLGSFKLAGASDWVDITSRVRRMSWSVSTRSGLLGGFSPGSASITLDNRDRDFDPLYLSGDYADDVTTGIRPGIPVRIRAEYGGATYGMFYGWVDRWTHEYEPAGPNAGDATATIQASDALAKLAMAVRAGGATVGTGERAEARFYRVLASVGWPADLSALDSSNVTSSVNRASPVQLAGTTLDGDPVQELQTLADAVGGAVFADGSGRVTWAGELFYQDRSTSITFDASPTAAVPVADVVPSYDVDELVNVCAAAADGVASQSSENAASIASYGRFGSSLTGLPLASVTDLKIAAARRTWLLGEPRYRVRSVEVIPRLAYANGGLSSLLAMRHLDKVAVTFQPPGSGTITQACWVEGWSHSVGPGGDWQCSVSLSDASQFSKVLRLNDDAGVLYSTSNTTNYTLG